MSATDPKAAWEEARNWFEVASEDLRVTNACLRLTPPSLGNAAYHCQQAAEKVIKGLLVGSGVSFRKVHDLDELAGLASPLYPPLATDLDQCRRYSAWATDYRYPPEDEAVPPACQDIEEAVTILQRLLSGALRIAGDGAG